MRMSKLMLPAVTVAGALALAGCGGGGGGTTPTVDNCATEALPFEGGDGECYASETAYDTLVANRKAADEAIKAADEAAEGLDATSTSEDVGAVEKLIEAAETAINALPESEREAKMAELDTADGNVDIIKTVLGLTEDVNTQTELANDNAAATRRNQLIITELRKARKALSDAEGLSDAAVTASKRLGAGDKDVNGSSQKVYDNVMTALNARKLINDEKEKADAVVKALGEIETDGLSEAAKEVITDAIEDAGKLAGDINAILAPGTGEDDPLKDAESAVRGRTSGAEIAAVARARANAVADTMETAIGNVADVTDGANNPAIKTVGAPGRTFAQITGASAAGLVVTSALSDDISPTDDTAEEIPANSGIPANYNGIPGRLFCSNGATGTCTVVDIVAADDDTTSTGTVVFRPDSPLDIYSASTPDADYEAVQNAATYGYWLNAAGTAIVRNAESLTDSGNRNRLLWTAETTAEAGDDDVTATYSGDAGGYSERTVGTGSSAVQSSGEFTAKVELEATFGGNTGASLEGNISGFAAARPDLGAGHVNGSWVVDLKPIVFNAAGAPTPELTDGNLGEIDDDNYRSTEVGATDGGWSALPYGKLGTSSSSDDRTHPAGFVGGFTAEFKDGSAAGVYHADK